MFDYKRMATYFKYNVFNEFVATTNISGSAWRKIIYGVNKPTIRAINNLISYFNLTNDEIIKIFYKGIKFNKMPLPEKVNYTLERENFINYLKSFHNNVYLHNFMDNEKSYVDNNIRITVENTSNCKKMYTVEILNKRNKTRNDIIEHYISVSNFDYLKNNLTENDFFYKLRKDILIEELQSKEVEKLIKILKMSNDDILTLLHNR